MIGASGIAVNGSLDEWTKQDIKMSLGCYERVDPGKFVPFSDDRGLPDEK